MKKVFAILLTCELAVLALHFALYHEGILSAATALVIGIVVVLLISREEETSELLAIFGLALFLRLTITAILHFSSVSAGEDGLFFPDSRAYDRVGSMVARLWRTGESTNLTHFARGVATGYYYVTGIVYFVFGNSVLAAKVVTCVLGSFIPVYVFKIGRTLFCGRVAIVASVLSALSPLLIFYSGLLLKDTIVALIIVLWIWHIVQLSRKVSVFRIVIFVLTIAPLIITRFYIFSMILFLTAVWLLVKVRPRPLAIAIAGGMVYVSIVAIGNFSILGRVSLTDILQLLPGIHGASVAPGSYFAYTEVNDIPSILKTLPAGLAHFALTPLPWNTSGIMNVLIPSSILRYLLWPLVLVGGVQIIRRVGSLAWIILGLVVILPMVYAIIFLGGGPRHYVQMYPMMMMAAAAGWVYARKLWMTYLVYLSVLATGLAAFVIGGEIAIGVIALIALASIIVARSKVSLEASPQGSTT